MSQQSLIDRNSDYQFKAGLKNNYLKLQLFVKKVYDKYYSLQLNNDEFPQQLKTTFGDINLLFQCIKAHIEVIPQEGIIKAKANYTFKSKTITKVVPIKLNERTINMTDHLQLKLRYLSENIQQLKLPNIPNWFSENENKLKCEIIEKQQSNNQMNVLSENLSEAKKKIQQAYRQLDKLSFLFDKQYKQVENIIQKCMANDFYQQQQNTELQQKIEKPHKKNKLKQVQKSTFLNEQAAQTKNKSNKQFYTRQNQKIQAIDKPGLNNFILKNNIIKHIGQTNEGNQIVLKKRVRVAGKNGFKVKIIETTNSNIYIGLIQQKFTKLKKTNNVVCYFGHDGEIWDGKPIKNMGKGFVKDDIVEVRIKQGLIVWKVNGVTVANYASDKFNDPIAIFKPFIEMGNNGDEIEWLF